MKNLTTTIVAIDPENGLHLRPATAIEAAEYKGFPVIVGLVLITNDPGEGIWFGGAGF